jgi:hypothetical protein
MERCRTRCITVIVDFFWVWCRRKLILRYSFVTVQRGRLMGFVILQVDDNNLNVSDTLLKYEQRESTPFDGHYHHLLGDDAMSFDGNRVCHGRLVTLSV